MKKKRYIKKEENFYLHRKRTFDAKTRRAIFMAHAPQTFHSECKIAEERDGWRRREGDKISGSMG